ncbi:MAG: hypothetical protein KC910_07050 [Candidatus Eremiobacteraeota bacterium]|nr:hypothetical protein [Candidatus Eremiobacteraeota bacterium]
MICSNFASPSIARVYSHQATSAKAEPGATPTSSEPTETFTPSGGTTQAKPGRWFAAGGLLTAGGVGLALVGLPYTGLSSVMAGLMCVGFGVSEALHK